MQKPTHKAICQPVVNSRIFKNNSWDGNIPASSKHLSKFLYLNSLNAAFAGHFQLTVVRLSVLDLGVSYTLKISRESPTARPNGVDDSFGSKGWTPKSTLRLSAKNKFVT